jgi:LmbE family N-acetylglucosaminyl deacetylase
MSNKLWVSPHSDDAVLFGAFTLMREKPLVLTVTDSWIQFNRGENITAEQRRLEDEEAMKVLGCSIVFGGIRDDVIDAWAVKDKLSRFRGFNGIYAPAIQGGNEAHDLIGKVALEVFGDVKQYTTYSATELYTTGKEEVKPDSREMLVKEAALNCYQSQIQLPATKPHFEAVKNRSEWFI